MGGGGVVGVGDRGWGIGDGGGGWWGVGPIIADVQTVCVACVDVGAAIAFFCKVFRTSTCIVALGHRHN